MVVKASNAAGVWSDGERVSVVIEKPFWQQEWFYFIAILLFAILIFMATYSYVQQGVKQKLRRLEKQAAIEKERNRISKDMHDEIGNGLTHIALLSELILAQHNPPADIKREITAISMSSGKLVQTMSEIIWALNPQNDTLENLLA
jgi:signal transduction histidine kinase